MNDGQPTLRLKGLWLFIGWMMVLTVVYLSLTHNPPEIKVSFQYLDKVEHSLAYFILMGWFVQIYSTLFVRKIYFVGFIAMGVALEIFQGMGGVRFFEYGDMIANTLGVLIAFVLSGTPFQFLLRRIEHRYL